MNYQEIVDKWKELHYSTKLIKAVVEQPELYLSQKIAFFERLELHKKGIDLKVKVFCKDNTFTVISRNMLIMSNNEVDKLIKRAEAHMIASRMSKNFKLDYKSIVWCLLSDASEIPQDWQCPALKPSSEKQERKPFFKEIDIIPVKLGVRRGAEL